MPPGLSSRTLKGFRRVTARWSATSDLDRLVAGHTGHLMNKWKHYFEIYDRHLSRYRDQPVTLLEIGVSGGGSLAIWRKFLGPKARIVGMDINPDCRIFEAPGTSIVIGDQGAPEFLEEVAAKYGPFDIVIDDGSHRFDHQLATFRTLFKHIRADGIYACEDLCSSYWKEGFDGGVRKPGTFVEFLKELIDEMNAWFWRDGVEAEAGTFPKVAHGIHFYPTLAVIEKRAMEKPIITPVGRTSDMSAGKA
jgi:hypothetical protein